MPHKSIKQKILFNVSIVVFIGGLLTSAGTAFISYQREVENAVAHLSHETELKSNKIISFLENSISLSKNLAKEEAIISFFESNDSVILESEAKSVLEKFRLKNGFLAVYLSNTKGVISLSNNDSAIGQDFGNYSFFKKSIGGYSGVGASYDNVSKKTDLFISEAIRNNNNQIIGAAIIRISSSRINYLIEENSSPETIDMLSDENGIIFASNDKSRINKSLGNLSHQISERLTTENIFPGLVIESLGLEEIENIVINKIEEINSKTYQKERVEYVFNVEPIAKTSLYFISENDMNIMKETANRLAIVLFLPTIVTVIILIILIYFLILRILKPIDILKKEATQIGLGNFDQKKLLETGDELEELEDTLINTSNQLKSAYGEMEEKVKLRTLEIETKNKQAERANFAMINIMEDIEKEKEKVSSLAKDLEKFKLALDNTSEQVLLADKTGAILYANKGMENLTGYKIKEVLGKKTADLWRIIKDETAEKEMWNTIVNKKKAITKDMPSRRKDGSEYTTITTISPILNDAGEVEFMISISHDITKEKEVDRAKTEFVSLASHQLRTPLSSVNWYSEMLLSGDAGKLNDDQATFVTEIYKGNKRMVDLVNSLLDVSRLELGTFTIMPEIMDICEPAKSVINELKPSTETKKIKLEMKCGDNLPKIKADPKLTRIIFQNLLSNAVKYTPEGGSVSVSIEAEKEDILIKISDTGYGITKSQQDKIFTKLFRADNVKARDTEGTGLGLYIIKSILDSSGGSISFESVEDEGSTFSVRLPLKGMTTKTGTKVLGE